MRKLSLNDKKKIVGGGFQICVYRWRGFGFLCFD